MTLYMLVVQLACAVVVLGNWVGAWHRARDTEDRRVRHEVENAQAIAAGAQAWVVKNLPASAVSGTQAINLNQVVSAGFLAAGTKFTTLSGVTVTATASLNTLGQVQVSISYPLTAGDLTTLRALSTEFDLQALGVSYQDTTSFISAGATPPGAGTATTVDIDTSINAPTDFGVPNGGQYVRGGST